MIDTYVSVGPQTRAYDDTGAGVGFVGLGAELIVLARDLSAAPTCAGTEHVGADSIADQRIKRSTDAVVTRELTALWPTPLHSLPTACRHLRPAIVVDAIAIY
jgi:hypothetical protein